MDIRDDEPKTQHLHVRISSAHKELIERAARRLGLSTSAFLIQQAVPAATKELFPADRIVLDDQERDRILMLLDAPPEPPARLDAAVRYVQKTHRRG